MEGLKGSEKKKKEIVGHSSVQMLKDGDGRSRLTNASPC